MDLGKLRRTSVDEVQPGTQVMDNSWADDAEIQRDPGPDGSYFTAMMRPAQRHSGLACEEEGCTI